MAKRHDSGGEKFEKNGYRPFNEGYSPKERSYTLNTHAAGLPKAPKGGTGESAKKSNNATTGGQKK